MGWVMSWETEATLKVSEDKEGKSLFKSKSFKTWGKLNNVNHVHPVRKKKELPKGFG